MKADVLDLHFLGSLKKHSQVLAEHNTALNRLSKKLEVVHNDWHETKTSLNEIKAALKEQKKAVGQENTVSSSSLTFSVQERIERTLKFLRERIDEKSEAVEEAIYTAQRCQQRLDSMMPYWGDRLLQQDGKLLDYDDKFSAINKRITEQDTDYQEQMKMVDTLLEIVESDINKEEALDVRLKKLELDMERIYELMAQQVTETQPLVVTETLQNLEFAELEKPKSLAKPAVKKVFDDKENKKPITSEYAKYFNDKTVQKVEANLFEDAVEKKEVKNTSKQPIKHAKTKSVGVDPFKKK